MGFVLDPSVCNDLIADSVISQIREIYGKNSEELNATFHKSFAKVKNTPTELLVFEQIIHYLTTYGAENMGVYNESSVYIPSEVLDAPEFKDDIRLVVIRGMTKNELKDKLVDLLSSGIALSKQSVEDAIEIAQFVKLDKSDVANIKNKEVKTALYDYLDIVPKDPVEFLRYVVYRSTEKTLLIKNKDLIISIKNRNNQDIVKYFEIYESEFGLHKLAQIFNRYKPIFLAFRTNDILKKKINRIRRLAKTNHKPMQEDLLNTITSRLEKHEAPTVEEFNKAMSNTNIFRKIRLANALKFRMLDSDSILYKIRNGKSYAKDFDFKNKHGAGIMFDVVIRHIANDIRPNVEGKTYFIPKGLNYALPATEKQFTGDIPSGSYIETPKDMVFGIHWEDQSRRIDLDLSMSDIEGKIGWDGKYRGEGVQFSGDVTSAPKPRGASEAFHIGKTARGSWLTNLNFYNYSDMLVPFKIFVTEESKDIEGKNYTMNPNNILAFSNSSIDIKQKIFGLVVSNDKYRRFYFSETGFQNSISSHHNKYAEKARKYLLESLENSISLNEVLMMAGANIVDEMADDVIDLSTEAIDKTTILNLLSA